MNTETQNERSSPRKVLQFKVLFEEDRFEFDLFGGYLLQEDLFEWDLFEEGHSKKFYCYRWSAQVQLGKFWSSSGNLLRPLQLKISHRKTFDESGLANGPLVVLPSRKPFESVIWWFWNGLWGMFLVTKAMVRHSLRMAFQWKLCNSLFELFIWN